MQVLIAYTPQQSRKLISYKHKMHIWKKGYASVEADEAELEALKRDTEKIEWDFEIELQEVTEEMAAFAKEAADEKILAASLGRVCGSSWEESYNLDKNIYYKRPQRKGKGHWIHCYSENDVISASQYIRTVKFLKQKAVQEGRKLMLYAAVKSRLPYYEVQSLAYEVIDAILEQEDLIIKKVPRFKHYLYKAHRPNVVCLEELSFKHIEKSRACRQRQPLYNDLFYELIPPNQKIYMPLKWADEADKSYYEALGLNVIDMGGKILILYDEKQKLESHSDTLSNKVAPNFFNPILSKVKPHLSVGDHTAQIKLPQDTPYTGKGVYIGYVTTRPINYRNDYLRFSDGKSKIAWIWQQTAGDEGIAYTKKQIDAALEENRLLEGLALEEADSIDTYLLGLMGDPSKVGIPPAYEAQFIVGQITSAPDNLQYIFAGEPNAEAVQMADLMVAIDKMIERSKADGKALALCIPYNTNIDSHDGATYYNQLLSLLALEEGCCFIVPTGEEADKKHHQEIEIDEEGSSEIEIIINEPMNYLVGVVAIKGVIKIDTKLYPPGQTDAVINLRDMGTAVYDQTVVYSNGQRTNFISGDDYILFRMEHLVPGLWRIGIETTIKPEADIAVWLAEEAFNPSAQLVEYTPFTTLGSNAATPHLFSVGGFDRKNIVVPRSSGRGFNWDNLIMPICVLSSIAKVEEEKVYSMEGTVVAAAVLTAEITLLYSKWIQEVAQKNFNTLIFISLIKGYLSQFPTSVYPNRNEGYGIFSEEQFNLLMARPFYAEVT